MCLSARIARPSRGPRDHNSSDTFGALLDGFDPFDGSLADGAFLESRSLLDQAEEAVRHRRTKSFLANPSCVRVARDAVRCSDSLVLRAAGRPRLTIKATGRFRPFSRAFEGEWRWRGTYSL